MVATQKITSASVVARQSKQLRRPRRIGASLIDAKCREANGTKRESGSFVVEIVEDEWLRRRFTDADFTASFVT
jgi:hypothetical protein